MSTPTPNLKTAQKWARIGQARVAGLGVRIDCDDGRAFAVSAEGAAGLFFENEPATVYRIDPAGDTEPQAAGTMDVSASGRMLLVMLEGEAYTGMQLPAADLLAHYRRADRGRVPVVAPPSPSWAVA